MTYYLWHPDSHRRKEPESLLQWVTAYSKAVETGMCERLLPTSRTARVLLPVTAPEQKFCESLGSGVCASGKGPATRSQWKLSAPKRSCCRAAAIRGSADRANLGMLINPPLGGYLLGKCLTFICTSAVNREAFTFFPAQ